MSRLRPPGASEEELAAFGDLLIHSLARHLVHGRLMEIEEVEGGGEFFVSRLGMLATALMISLAPQGDRARILAHDAHPRELLMDILAASGPDPALERELTPLLEQTGIDLTAEVAAWRKAHPEP